jgi:hypothetical protein
MDGETALSEGGDLTAAYVTPQAFSAEHYDVSYNEIDLEANEADDALIDMGQLSQIAIVNMNAIDIAGDITISDAFDGDAGLLEQIGTDYEIGGDETFGNLIEADGVNGVSLGADAENTSVQAAYLNVNSISAGGTLNGNVEQEIIAQDYVTNNRVDASSFDGLVSVANFAQVAQVNLNEVSAGLFDGANIDQNISNGVDIRIDNTMSAISDIGSVNVEGVVQQAIARVNSISGL